MFPEVVLDTLAGRTVSSLAGLCYRVDAAGQWSEPQATRPQVPMDEVPTPTYDEFFERLERSPLRAELWPEVAILF